MADEIVYRLLQGDGAELTEDSAAKTVTISVPGLTGKVNVGDIVQATELLAGIAMLASTAEVQAGANAQKIVTPAGLAAASQANASDASSGKILKMGAFGLGAGAIELSTPNLNSDRATGFYYAVTPVNGPPSTGSTNGFVLHLKYATGQFAAQIFFNPTLGGRTWIRYQAINFGAWNSWVEVFHTANFDPNSKANTSGTYSGLSVGNASQLNGQTDAMLTPPGLIGSFAVAAPPNGWLAANGAVVSRASFANLFAAVGTTYGAGNGTTTFNLPDCRGMFVRGWDAGRGIDAGRAIGTTQSSQNLSHSHGGQVASNGGHNHSGSADSFGDHVHQPIVLGGSSSDVGDAGPFVVTSSFQSNGQQTIASSQTGLGGAHAHNLSINAVADHSHLITADGFPESRPINIAFLTCIKF